MRVDSWLWAARFFKSRTLATAACRAGKVRLNNTVVKAASEIKPGDTISWRDALRERKVVVVELLATRVGAAIAVTAYTDLSPAPPSREERLAVGLRDPHSGRPTKRERRQTDDWLGFRR